MHSLFSIYKQVWHIHFLGPNIEKIFNTLICLPPRESGWSEDGGDGCAQPGDARGKGSARVQVDLLKKCSSACRISDHCQHQHHDDENVQV